MSDKTPEEEQVRSEQPEAESLEDLEVSEEEAQDVKGGQEMPPFPRQR